MSIHFRQVSYGPFHQFSVSAPSGALIAVLGDEGSGVSELLQLAAGRVKAATGAVEFSGAARYIGVSDALDFSSVETIVMDQALAVRDLTTRATAAAAVERLRKAGATILLATHDAALAIELADEAWWIDKGTLAGKGDPREITAAYQRHAAEQIRQAAAGLNATITPSMRRGDGRAQLDLIQTLGEDSRPAMVFQSGQLMVVRVKVRFNADVADPVVGIMIRTRVGLEVYGTNTELERKHFGPCRAGQTVTVDFGFRCELCPQEYTITAASHDPDGVWHDWMEDALAFSVADSRFTAGVANLRASVNITL